MNRFALLLLSALCLCGCASRGELDAHQAKVNSQRALLPYTVQIGKYSHSMQGVIEPGSTQTVRALRYDSLQSGLAVLYWPLGMPAPMVHFTHQRIGTDSWSTRGVGQADDLLYLGVLLTRENYIGVIW